MYTCCFNITSIYVTKYFWYQSWKWLCFKKVNFLFDCNWNHLLCTWHQTYDTIFISFHKWFLCALCTFVLNYISFFFFLKKISMLSLLYVFIHSGFFVRVNNLLFFLNLSSYIRIYQNSSFLWFYWALTNKD